MSLARLSVRRGVTVLMGMLAVLVLGVISWSQLKVDLFPDITFPVLAVYTIYPGAGPQEVEQYVTKPIEERCGLVKDIKHLSSTSQEGVSVVLLEFDWGTDMDDVAFDTREKVDQVIEQLPDDAKRPVLQKYDPQTVFPIMTMNVTGMNDLQELRKLTEDVVQPDLEKVEGVAAVDVFGGLEREVQVLVDRDRLAAYGLGVSDIQQAITAENLNVPGGTIEVGQREFTVRTLGEFRRPEDIEDIAIKVVSGVPVRLRDVAEVRDTHKEVRQTARFGGEPSVTLVIRKESGANAVQVAHRMRKAVQELNERLPQGLKVTEAYASADYIESALENMYSVAEEGAILAVIIIFLFLSSGRSTLVIATSIPLSLLVTAVLMRFSDMTLNMVTLGGLTLAIGRIVDDSIVVLENVYRHIEEGENPARAAVAGAGEVGVAIMAATLTTICVFAPLAVVGGLVGVMFSPMAKTVATALLASLVISLTVVPMASSRLLRPRAEGAAGNLLLRVVQQALAAWERAYLRVERTYGRTVTWCLSNRATVLGLAVGIFIFSLFLAGLVGMEFFPHTDRGEIAMTLQMPVGTNIQTTDAMATEVEDLLLSYPEIIVLSTTVGEAGGGTSSGDVRTASFQARLKPWRERERSTDDIIAEVRKKFGRRAGVQISFQSGMGGGQSPIVITIYGDDLNELARLGDALLPKLKQVNGLVDARLNWERGTPEYQLLIDRQKAGTYGLSTAQIARSVRTLMRGEETTKFRQAGKEYDITVRLPAATRQDIEQLKDLVLPGRDDARVPLTQVATIVETMGPTLVSRYERRRSVEIYADKVKERPLDAIVADCDAVLKAVGMPVGYSYEFRGSEEDRRESFSGLFISLGLGILLIYIILASQFESVVQPFIIMLAIPLEVIGVFVALLITGTPISIMVMLGILLLTGIVVSNSILLVHVVNLLRERGFSTREALVRGGELRLRPILMTALATLAAMTPMALALREGSDMWRPLGITVLGGLVSSTFLTLLVVPVAYSVTDQIATRLGLRLHAVPTDEEEEAPTPRAAGEEGDWGE